MSEKKASPFHLTLEERREIERLNKEGKSLQEIANTLCRGKTTIRQEYRRCERKKYNAEVAHEHFTSSWRKRSLKLCKTFSPEDEEKIYKFIDEERSRADIRKTLNCSFFRIENWFAKNMPDYKGAKVSSMSRRLDTVEQQIEILFDLIKPKT